MPPEIIKFPSEKKQHMTNACTFRTHEKHISHRPLSA